MDPTTTAKTYWLILKKIPCIPPFFHDNKFITDFQEKSELFNSFFSKQCSTIDNSSELLSNLAYHTNKRII